MIPGLLLQMELVGSIIGGVAAAAWSPDFELFALITRAETDQAALIIMSRDWQVWVLAIVS